MDGAEVVLASEETAEDQGEEADAQAEDGQTAEESSAAN